VIRLGPCIKGEHKEGATKGLEEKKENRTGGEIRYIHVVVIHLKKGGGGKTYRREIPKTGCRSQRKKGKR